MGHSEPNSKEQPRSNYAMRDLRNKYKSMRLKVNVG